MHCERLTPALGATVHGFDRATLGDPSTFDKLHAALMEHQVLFTDRHGPFGGTRQSALRCDG